MIVLSFYNSAKLIRSPNAAKLVSLLVYTYIVKLWKILTFASPHPPVNKQEGFQNLFWSHYRFMIVLSFYNSAKLKRSPSATKLVSLLVYTYIVKLWKILTFASPHPPVNKQGTFGDKTGQNGLIITCVQFCIKVGDVFVGYFEISFFIL